jgi:DNA-binding NarL/FixJ family response regulator
MTQSARLARGTTPDSSPRDAGSTPVGPASHRVSSAVVTIRVVLAEDHALLRQGLERLLTSAEDIDVVGSAHDLPSLETMVRDLEPDVVITDIRMPPTGTDEGIRFAAQLRRERPTTGVVVLSQHVDAGYALALLAEGSARRGYLLKERVADADELVNAVREVAGGGSRIDAQVVDELVNGRRSAAPTDLDRLTPRELEVLSEMAQGKSNGSIASALVLSERAVEKHTNSIFSKLGLSEERDLNRRVKAVLVYLNGATGG